jgi:hypothetical protein
MPSLIGKVVRTSGWKPFLMVGNYGWIVAISSLIPILIGMGSIVRGAFVLL